MGEGPECCRRAEWPLGRRLERVTALVDHCRPVDRRSTPSARGGSTSTSADVSVSGWPGFH